MGAQQSAIQDRNWFTRFDTAMKLATISFYRSISALAAWAALIFGLNSSLVQQSYSQQPTQRRLGKQEPAEEQQSNQKQPPENQDHAENRPMPDIRFDRSPLPAALKARTSYASIAKKVAPSIVNVYSTRTVKNDSMSPFFNEPFLRRFFGGQGGQGGQGGEGATRPRTQQGLGSGVIISDDGYIVTNNHVVEGATDIRVALVSGDEYPATLVGTDPATDVAVLKVDKTGLPAITLADSALLQVGDTVLAFGNPFGVGQTVTMRIVSGLGRTGFGIVDYEDFIQTDASINPGNSGGALTDVEGRLVGVNTAILSRTGGNQGVGFAVPVDIARNVMEQIIRTGHVVRGYLGIYIQPLTPDLARAFHLTEHKGALVASVSARSPAAKAGLKEGDVITVFNNNAVSDSAQLRLMVAETAPGTKAEVSYLRNGQPGQTAVTLGELPTQELAQAQGRGAPETRSGQAGFVYGIQLAPIDAQTRRQFSIPNEVQGVVVTDVEPGTAAERAGLQQGDVIEDINRQPVATPRDATRSLSNAKAGSVLLRVWSSSGSRYVVLDTSSEAQTRPSPGR